MLPDSIQTPPIFVTPVSPQETIDKNEMIDKRKTTTQVIALLILQTLVVSTLVVLAAIFVTPHLPPALAITAIVVLTVTFTTLTWLVVTYFSKIKEAVIKAIRYIVATFIDFGAVLLAIVTFPCDLTKKNPTQFAAPVQTTPVLCVHGYMHRSSAFIMLRNRLEKQGVGPVYTINLGFPSCKSIKDFGRRVAEEIKDIQKKTGRDDIFLIGHSMGGDVNNEFIVNSLTENVKIKGVVTMGSPLLGTKVACIGPGRCAREMAYQSDYLTEQQEKISKIDIPFLHIASSVDVVVQPTSSAMGSRAPNQEKYVVNWTGHAGLLYSSSIANRIVEFYKKKTQATS